MMNLPLEIQFDILIRVPVKSLCRIRCVCKSLLQVIDSPCFKSMHSRSLILTNNTFAEESPLITNFTHRLKSHSLLRFDTKPASEILSICEAKGSYSPYFSFYNLLFFQDFGCFRGDNNFLIDPFTEEVLTLPPVTETLMLGKSTFGSRDFYGMGFDRINNTYKIVRIIRSPNIALVHVLGTRSWREIPHPPYDSGMGELLNKIECIWCAYGDVHFVFSNKESQRFIRSFDFTKEEFYFTPHPPTLSFSSYDRYIILEGRMAVISVNMYPLSVRTKDSFCKSIDVWVMKDYKSKNWTREYHLKLSEELQGYCMLRCGEWDHGLYFVALSDNEFIYFDLRNSNPEDEAKYVKIHEKYLERECMSDYNDFNLRRTLISLKQFHNSETTDSTYHNNLVDFSKKYLWDQEIKPKWPAN